MIRQVSIELSSEPSSQDPHPNPLSDSASDSASSPGAAPDKPETMTSRPQPFDVTANPMQHNVSPTGHQHSSRHHSLASDRQRGSPHQSPFASRFPSFTSTKQHQQTDPLPKLPPIEVATYGRGNNNVDNSEGDGPAGISPSSTMRDLEAACGPLSAASGSLDAMLHPLTQESGILPWFWTQTKIKCHHCCEYLPHSFCW